MPASASAVHLEPLPGSDAGGETCSWLASLGGRRFRIELFDAGEEPRGADAAAVLFSIAARIYALAADAADAASGGTEVARLGPCWSAQKGLLVLLAGHATVADGAAVEALVDAVQERAELGDYTRLAEALAHGRVRAEGDADVSRAALNEALWRIKEYAP